MQTVQTLITSSLTEEVKPPAENYWEYFKIKFAGFLFWVKFFKEWLKNIQFYLMLGHVKSEQEFDGEMFASAQFRIYVCLHLLYHLT